MTTATQKKIIPEVMDLKPIVLIPEKAPAKISHIKSEDGFFLNTLVSDEFRIREPVYNMLKEATKKLPAGCHFMIFEAYRPLKKQESLWHQTYSTLEKKYPDLNKEQMQLLCENFVANPYDGIGSGHQAACALDLTLCDAAGVEFDMGTKMQEMNEKTKTLSPDVTQSQMKNRLTLKNALENVGFVNYPAEWWHFSYGDHQWAYLLGRKDAFFGPIDI